MSSIYLGIYLDHNTSSSPLDIQVERETPVTTVAPENRAAPVVLELEETRVPAELRDPRDQPEVQEKRVQKVRLEFPEQLDQGETRAHRDPGVTKVIKAPRATEATTVILEKRASEDTPEPREISESQVIGVVLREAFIGFLVF